MVPEHPSIALFHDRRALRLEERQAICLAQRILQGVYATRTSADWTRLSRGVSERRWMQDRNLLEVMTHPAVQRRLRDRRMDWPIERLWPQRTVWMGMARPLEEERSVAIEEIAPQSVRRSGSELDQGTESAMASGASEERP